jgi:hypothetical protein
VRFQAQAVLRRDRPRSPLRLAGVLVDGAFYPGSPKDALGPLNLEVGLVALAPLTPVVTASASRAAEAALDEARGQWTDATAPPEGQALAWRPIRDVRPQLDGHSVGELIALMSTANDARMGAIPSTPPYHSAAREVERLASVVFDTTSSEERHAEDAARRDGGRITRRPDA